MSAIAINHINIRVPIDLLPVIRDFYCNVLDLRVGQRPAFTSQGYWLYAGDQALVHLSVIRPGDQRGIDQCNTLDHVAFQCRDQQVMCDRLTALGVQFEVDAVPGRPIRQVFLRDPVGNGIELSFDAAG